MSAAPQPAGPLTPRSVFAPATEGPWLFGRRADLALFGGSALLSIALLGVGWTTGVLEHDAPEWAWIACVLVVDVAHVWSTVFRVYLDGAELKRRPLLYASAPLLCWLLGAMTYAFSSAAFWTVLAYLAVLHFVRQQYGWVALYRRRAGERGALDRALDTAAIYAATIGPLVWWHAHLPRRFAWFVPGDFVPGLATWLVGALTPLYWVVLTAFVARQLALLSRGRPVNVGKVVVVLSTWLCWWIGVVALDGDYAFTVTNVLIHGIPYLALTFRYGRARARAAPATLLGRLLRGGVPAFLGVIVLAAFMEEALWDRLVWHERGWLFGEARAVGEDLLVFLVPLLALPQATHYVLDAFVWKVRSGQNPSLADELLG